jgi:DNA-binding HxlR family transcriptional regulator
MDTIKYEQHRTSSMIDFSRNCPSRTVIDVLANKWALYVLGLLERIDRPMRFGELRRSIGGITQKSLTKTLRTLERDGFIDRKVYASVPPRVEYRLTDLGREAGKLTGAIAVWALTNAPRVIDSRLAFDDRSSSGDERSAGTWTQRGVVEGAG